MKPARRPGGATGAGCSRHSLKFGRRVRKMAKEGVPQMVKIFQSYSDRIYLPDVPDEVGEEDTDA